MSLVTAENLSKYYGAQDVFSAISFRIGRGDKIALVGANGVGKTTLLRIIAGLDTSNTGRVHIAKSVRIGYLAQRADLQGDRSLYEEMLDAFADLRALQGQLHQLEQSMSDACSQDRALERYGDMLQAFELAGGYTYEQRLQRTLMGLGFATDEFQKPLSMLSGGQHTRAQLAKLILLNPDLLLLDEPTNHLDLQAIQWLEQHLADWKGSLVVVAHDRYFLNRVVSQVWEMDAGSLGEYVGNYDQYARLREERLQRRRLEYEAQREYVARTEDFVRRYKAGQRSRQAQGREKLLKHLEPQARPRQQQKMKLTLQSSIRGGDHVLSIEALQTGYDQPLIRFPDLKLLRGQRAALLGPNGCGKTTFLKTVLGQVPPLGGRFKVGANVHLAYFAQGHENLNDQNTVLEEILKVRNLPLEQARGLLGRFLFSGDDVNKAVSQLSGGERGRVALAILALQGANFLLLDEPTNHLDIQSQELLEKALREFDGTILFVSHDRYFIDAVATQLWVVSEGQVTVHSGNYSQYLAEMQTVKQVPATDAPKVQVRGSQRGEETRREERDLKQRRAKQTQLEGEIERLEAALSRLARELEQASRAQRTDRVYDLGREYEDVQKRLQSCLEDWVGVA